MKLWSVLRFSKKMFLTFEFFDTFSDPFLTLIMNLTTEMIIRVKNCTILHLFKNLKTDHSFIMGQTAKHCPAQPFTGY